MFTKASLTEKVGVLWEAEGKPSEVRCAAEESRGIDLGYEVPQVLAAPSECKIGESWKKRDSDCGIRTRSPFFRARILRKESDVKCLEHGQRGKTGDHSLW